MIPLLRWLLLIPACIAAWYVALLVGIYLHGVVFSYCPPEMVESGMYCDAKWFPAAEQAVMCFGVAMSAIFVVLTATFIAPAHRIFVSRFALGVGAIVAAVMAYLLGAYAEFISAIVAGSLATLAIAWILRRSRYAPVDIA